MRNLIGFLSIAVISACLSFTASADTKFNEDWKEKFKSEKIAFLTMEVGLTPEEAQLFWPVYNQVEKEKDEAMINVIDSYRDLRKATDEGKNGKELSNLLDRYVEAQKKLRDIENGVAEKYKSVLPVEKVAKLYVAEEKFRRNQIRNMKGGPQGPVNGKPGPGR